MSLTPTHLRCEHLTDPLAVANLQPRLSWVLQQELSDKNKSQSAFRILVSSKRSGKGDLWDSGKVVSDQTRDVVYSGTALKSRQTAHWKVIVWDENDNSGKWSEEASWTLAPEDWSGSWIGFDEPLNKDRLPDFVGTHWINHPDDPMDNSPKGTFFLRRVIEIDDPAPTRVDFILTVDDFFIARINGQEIGRSDSAPEPWKRPVLIDATKSVKVGENTIEIEMRSSGLGPAAAIGKMVFWRGNQSGELVTDAIWQIRRDQESEYKPVRVIGQHGVAPWQGLRLPMHYLPAPRILRKQFAATKKVSRATFYATSLGIWEAEINGSPVTNEWLAPGWTDYRIRVHYRAYDVTKFIVSGANAVGVTLSDGWYAGYVGFGKRNLYGEHTRFNGMLCLDYADGTSEVIGTDETWHAATGGKLQGDLLMGETFNAQKALANFSKPGTVEADWHPVAENVEVDCQIEPYPMSPCTTYAEISTRSVTKLMEGRFVFDLGVNFAGLVTLHLKGMKGGEEIFLRHGEMLNDDGTVYVTNLRSAQALDTYVAKEGDQEWTPRSTFHGFRYVQLDGNIAVDESTIRGHAISNAQEPTSGFSCSDNRLNKLWENIDRTFRSNFIEVPTDCPQRDERMGWTGDIEVFCRTAMLLADSQSFLDKWLVDMLDAQTESGDFPKVAPVIYALDDGGPAWADAGTIVPWEIYQVYKDKFLLAHQYESMKKFVEFNLARSDGTGLPPEKFHCYGDWLNVNASTPNTVLFTAYLARSTNLVSQAAKALGLEVDARRYSTIFDKIAKAFVEKFVFDDGWVDGRSQTGQVLAIQFGLVKGELKTKVFEKLVSDINEKGHLTTGFVGTKDLPLVLRDNGRADLAYKLLLSDEYPGWLFSVKHGATSIWERWNGWTPTDGFGDPGMNSFAHYAFGAVGQFMMETIGGIRLLEPGYEKVLIHVEPGPLEWGDCWYDSPRGRISVKWKVAQGKTKLQVDVPPTVTATVRLASGDKVVGSGHWTFES